MDGTMASGMLQPMTPTTPDGESWNNSAQPTPGVIGAQEVYRYSFVKNAISRVQSFRLVRSNHRNRT